MLKLSIRPQDQVGPGLAAQHCRKIDLQQFGATHLAVLDFVAGELGGAAECSIGQTAARANQVADVHAGLERILAR